jgi:polysaccharide export outer membrane protein
LLNYLYILTLQTICTRFKPNKLENHLTTNYFYPNSATKITKYSLYLVLFCCVILSLSSCGAYKSSILFKTDGNTDNAKFIAAMADAEKNYVIKKFHGLGINIFTNKGEMLLDPNGELKYTPDQQARIQQNVSAAMFGGSGMGAGGAGMPVGGSQGTVNQFAFPRYVVSERGTIFMPIVGELKIEGLTLPQADSLITKTFATYYKDVYAISKLLNRRVVVLGALGNRILPLEHESMNIIEVIAMAGNLGISARADNIRLIRNVSTKPEIQVLNLTTWEGLKAANLIVQPDDIIYIEPRRRTYRQETLQDIASVFNTVGGLLTTLATLATLGFVILK